MKFHFDYGIPISLWNYILIMEVQNCFKIWWNWMEPNDMKKLKTVTFNMSSHSVSYMFILCKIGILICYRGDGRPSQTYLKCQVLGPWGHPLHHTWGVKSKIPQVLCNHGLPHNLLYTLVDIHVQTYIEIRLVNKCLMLKFFNFWYEFFSFENMFFANNLLFFHKKENQKTE